MLKRALAGLVIAVAIGLVLIFRDNLLGALFSGVAGALVVFSLIRVSPRTRGENEVALEPIPFVDGEGEWKVRLDKHGEPAVFGVISQALAVDVEEARRRSWVLPAMLISNVSENHARELASRLKAVGASAVVIREEEQRG